MCLFNIPKAVMVVRLLMTVVRKWNTGSVVPRLWIKIDSPVFLPLLVFVAGDGKAVIETIEW